MRANLRIDEVKQEFAGVELGDQRLATRLQKMLEAIVANPDRSLPKALGSEKELTGAYRLLGNPRVSARKLLMPHVQETCSRARAEGTILALHDTSEFDFKAEGERDGLGPLGKNKQGFLGHFTLAISADGKRRPLGVLGFKALVRGKGKRRKRGRTQERLRPDRESQRWLELVENAEEKLEGQAQAIHVTDREGDFYGLLSALCEKRRRFVIRAMHNRKLASEEGPAKLFDALEAAAVPMCERQVEISARKVELAPKAKRQHPARRSRTAKLVFSATSVELKRAGLSESNSPSLKVNIVWIRETNAPAGEAPVDWKLLTTEPIEHEQDLDRIVEFYRARWTIEEYFKALKTGCAFGTLQLESLPSLLNALSIYIPVAWQLLLMRNVSRDSPDLPATTLFTTDHIAALRQLSKLTFSENPNAQDVTLAIAAIGGHLKRNGPPGWLVLGRGYNDFLLFYSGWAAARGNGESRKCV
jgi:hypothetical protein